ncbi:hypothetical protein TrispH2_001146 [Trichoplax sp. H2]|nr:hypothetical protein TrispH2_001146 [Trichoplax sp. H2]|eukprot:RDD46785.1 hypothetical protein TrispH2_001146 [Trichoplax sp. H2]
MWHMEGISYFVLFYLILAGTNTNGVSIKTDENSSSKSQTDTNKQGNFIRSSVVNEYLCEKKALKACWKFASGFNNSQRGFVALAYGQRDTCKIFQIFENCLSSSLTYKLAKCRWPHLRQFYIRYAAKQVIYRTLQNNCINTAERQGRDYIVPEECYHHPLFIICDQ